MKELRTLEPGLRLGKYEVTTHIASGGMGAVYKAVDRELRRTVALKVLPTQRAQSERDLERFRREARHAARLSHPNIVTLYEYGYDETEDVYFLAMEFIEGYDLAHHIARKGRLSPKETRNILIQTTEALAHAFSQGVIHRDIKPSNFLLARVRDKILVKLTDFGLALGGDEDEFKVTREGATVGTIDYMAPEQARDSRSADIRSDIYSLGCTAYHMLAGQPPFAEGGIGERVRKHATVPPTDVREYNPAVSPGLWGIVRSMLAKNPADRYANPAELLADLKRVATLASADDANVPTLQPIEGREASAATPVATGPTLVTVNTLGPSKTTPNVLALSPEPMVQAEPERPRPAKKKSRSKAKKRRGLPWKLIGAVAGVCAFLVLGFVAFDAFRHYTAKPTDPDGPLVKGSGKDAPVVLDPGLPPKPPVNDPKVPVNPPRDPVPPNPGATLVLEPLKGLDWPARQLVPFDAVGPRARLQDIKAVHIKGTIALASSPKLLNLALTWESHKRMKCLETSAFSGLGTSFLLVGNHGWITTGGVNRAVSGEVLGYFQTFHYATVLSNLIALNDAGFEIEKTETTPVRGKECFSILVKRPNRPPVKMFFDKDSNLLYKAEFHARFLDQKLFLQTNPTHVEIYFGNYQVVDGINHWRKQEHWHDGKRFSELNLVEVRFFRTADDVLFHSEGLDDASRRAMTDYRKEVIKNALFQMGPQAGTDFSRLVRGLAQKDPALRWTLREALVAYAELWRTNQATPLQGADAAALGALVLCLDDELPGFAIDGIAKLGPQAADAAGALVTFGQSAGDPKLLARAMTALKNTGARTEPALSLLVRLLDHPDTGVKDAAALALFQLGPERLQATRLASLMGWTNTQIKADAEKLLRQRLGTVALKDLPALREGLSHPVREVRLAYIDAVGSLQQDGRDATPDLLPLLTSTDKEISEHAVRTLEKLGKLVELAQDHADPAVVAASLSALRRKGNKSPEAFAIYEKQMKHGDDGVKDAAAQALVELAPDRLGKERLVELMARPRPLNLAATLALHKLDPANANLRSEGAAILVENLKPDVTDLRAFLAQPLKSKPASVLLDVGGGSAIAPIVQQLLATNNPKGLVQNQQIEPTAARCMAYELLKEFAKRAKTNQDKELLAALRKAETTLSNYWVLHEASLANQTNQPPELRQLRAVTHESARQAIALIKSIR